MLLAGSTHNFLSHFGKHRKVFSGVMKMTQVQNVRYVSVKNTISCSVMPLDMYYPYIFLQLSVFL